MTLADALPLQNPSIARRRELDIALIALGSLVVAVSAQIAIPLPWTPVPITGQTLGVLLVGASLGWRRGASSMALYLAEGAGGLPVFAGGGAGVVHLMGPTAGYLWSFPFAAALVGWLADRGWDRRLWTAVLAMALGELMVYAFGVPWLAQYIGWERVWMAGFWPFMPGAVVKLGVAGAALPFAWRLVGNRSDGPIS
jgi:biotin transport system substrate-specific component